MNILNRILSVAILVLIALPMSAQGLWLDASASKKLTKKWSASLGAEYRLADGMSRTQRWSVGISTDYSFAKWLKGSAGYEFLNDYNNAEAKSRDDYNIPSYNYWQQRHRAYASLSASLKLSRWHFSLRERWQYTYRPETKIYGSYAPDDFRAVIKTVEGRGENVLRSRLQVEYNIKHCPVTPYGSVEMYTTDCLEKMRYTIGADYEINKKHSIKLYYLYQDKADDDEADGSVIGISYDFKL